MARIYYTTSSTAVSTFTGNTNFNEKVSLTFTPNANKNYAIFWSGVVSGSSITNFNNVRLQKTTGTAATLQQFDVDRDDLLEEQALTGLAIYTAPGSPTQESFAVEGQTSVGTDSIYLSDVHITALELTADDLFSYASESISTNNNFYQSTDEIDAPIGDWYVFGSAAVNVNTTTIGSRGLMGVRMFLDGGEDTYMEHDSWYSENANNWTPYWGIVTASLGGQSFWQLQTKDNTAGTTSVRYRTLLALKKSGFYESFAAVDELLTTASTATITKLSLTATPTLEANTLVLSTWAMEPPGEVSVQAVSDFQKDDISVYTGANELLLEGQSIYDLFQEGYASVYNLPTSAVTWRTRLRSTSGTFLVGMKNTAIVMLALDSPEIPSGGVGNPATITSSPIGSVFTIRQTGPGNFVVGTQ